MTQYKDWTAVTKHKTPWELIGGSIPALADLNYAEIDLNTTPSSMVARNHAIISQEVYFILRNTKAGTLYYEQRKM